MPMHRLLMTIGLQLIMSGSLFAQPAPPKPTDSRAGTAKSRLPRLSVTTSTTSGPRSIAVSISGGVSLGVYEAGFLYLVGEAIKAQPDVMQGKLFTGASAGSANALISAVSSCLPSNTKPEADLGWKTWMPLGFNELFDKESVTPLSLFEARTLRSIYRWWRLR